jgi:hypothetical protein
LLPKEGTAAEEVFNLAKSMGAVNLDLSGGQSPLNEMD